MARMPSIFGLIELQSQFSWEITAPRFRALVIWLSVMCTRAIRFRFSEKPKSPSVFIHIYYLIYKLARNASTFRNLI